MSCADCGSAHVWQGRSPSSRAHCRACLVAAVCVDLERFGVEVSPAELREWCTLTVPAVVRCVGWWYTYGSGYRGTLCEGRL